MQVKSYNHQSIAEWSNSKLHSELIVCAQLNPDQNGMYNLDILSLDLSDRSKNLNVMGNAFYNVPFRCLAWDTFGERENTFSHGVIFGGMEDGSYTLWNAGEMISSYGKTHFAKTEENIENQPAFLYGEEAEDGSYPIMCAEWNSLKNNFLAFGSTDLLILDIGKDISQPEIKKPGNRNPHEGSYITSVSWNREVANILASASENGLIALWDIKSNRSIFEFKDSPSSNVGNRNVSICWSKTISTQLAVTLDDEKRNELQIWDLRNQKGPVAVFDRGHTKGINTMEWCQTDPDLILTAGRDNKIVCWNYTQEEAPISTQQLDQAIFDLKWSKKLRSIYSLALEDRTQIYTMDNTNLFSYVPKWYRVPIESSFCGNESVVKYSESEGQKLTEVKLSTLPQAQSPVHRLLRELEAALDENSYEEKSKESEFWKLIAIKNSSKGDEGIYDFLGFNKEKIVKEVEKYTGKIRSNHLEKTETQTKHKSKAYTPVIGQEAASFFASIGENQTKKEKVADSDNEENESVKYDMVPRNFNWDIGKERLIKHNILIGNYEGAIDAALKCGRTAEALIIAYSMDQNVFNSTLKTFFTETTDNFITDILKNITYRDNEELVRKYDLDSWRECVAMIHSLATGEKRRGLLNLLASRIREESERKTGKSKENCILPEDNPAIQCYVLSENFNEIASLYSENLRHFESGKNQRKEAVLEYAKRLILIFNSLSVEVAPSKSFHRVIREAAFIATEQNFKMVAYLLFSNFLFESSMKEVDMIINATKNLEEYRNSVVFKQINIPVMQFKEQQGQKGKKGGPASQQQDSRQSGQVGQPTNPNVPTKDKNVPRPPIFGKREEEKEIPQKPVPPPSLGQNRPRIQTPVYEQEEEPVEVPKTKTTAKKVPPPPGIKPPQRVSETPSYSHQPDYHHQQATNTSFETTEKKVMPPPGKGKKVPPPPPTGFGNEVREVQPVTHQAQEFKKSSTPNQFNGRVPPPPPSHESKVPPPPPSHQQSRVPPQTRLVKPPPPSNYHHAQEEDYEEEPIQQQLSKSQQFYQQQPQIHEQKSVKQPPPPISKVPPPPPPGKQVHHSREEEPSFHPQQNSRINESPVYGKQEVQSVKKMVPPPPPGRQPVQSYEDEPEANTVNSRSRIESSTVIKPPPVVGNKVGGRVPPPPPGLNKIEQPQVQHSTKPPVHNQQPLTQHSQQYPTQQAQYEAREEPQRPPQYETPVMKKPPPPVSGKKGPPPPPRR